MNRCISARLFGIHIFKVTASLRCVTLNFVVASPAAARDWRAWSLAIGRRGVITLLGVTAGNESHNASNARVVTAGKMGRNSSTV